MSFVYHLPDLNALPPTLFEIANQAESELSQKLKDVLDVFPKFEDLQEFPDLQKFYQEQTQPLIDRVEVLPKIAKNYSFAQKKGAGNSFLTSIIRGFFVQYNYVIQTLPKLKNQLEKLERIFKLSKRDKAEIDLLDTRAKTVALFRKKSFQSLQRDDPEKATLMTKKAKKLQKFVTNCLVIIEALKNRRGTYEQIENWLEAIPYHANRAVAKHEEIQRFIQ